MLGKLVFAGIHHITGDGKIALGLYLVDIGDNEDIVTLKQHILYVSFHNAFDRHRYKFDRAVRLLTHNLRTSQKSIIHQAAGVFDQLLDGSNLATQLKLAGTVNRPLNFHTVGENVNLASAHAHGISILKRERSHLVGADCEDMVGAAVIALHIYFLLPCSAAETASVGNQARERFAVLDLVEHRPLDKAVDAHERGIRRNIYHVTFLKSDVHFKFAGKDVVVHIHHRKLFTAPDKLDITQRSYFGYTARPVQGCEYCRERRKPVGSRSFHFAHNVHLDGAHIPKGQAHMRRAATQRRINLGQRRLDFAGRLLNRKARNLDRPYLGYDYPAFRSDLLLDGSLIQAPNVNDNFVTGAEHIVFGGGKILIGLETQVRRREYLVSPDPFTAIFIVERILFISLVILIVLGQALRLLGSFSLGRLALLLGFGIGSLPVF